MGVRLTTHFTCIGRGHGAPCLPANREEWEQMRREPWLAEMCKRIEKGDDELKHRLTDCLYGRQAALSLKTTTVPQLMHSNL